MPTADELCCCEWCGRTGARRMRKLNPRNLRPRYRLLCRGCGDRFGFQYENVNSHGSPSAIEPSTKTEKDKLRRWRLSSGNRRS